MEPGIEESSDQESEPVVEPATIPAAVRKLADHFTGKQPSSYIDGRGAAVALTAAPEAEKSMKDYPHSEAYTGKDGQIEKYKCRFLSQGFPEVKGLHYHESSFPTPTASSMSAVLVTAAVKGWELRHTLCRASISSGRHR